MKAGYSFNECMNYLESEHNAEIFRIAKEKMMKGEKIQDWISGFFMKSISSKMETFLNFLPVSEALSLSITLHQQESDSRKQMMKWTAYPVAMFLISLVGVVFFCLLCMPSLIDMMKEFDVSSFGIELMYHGLLITALVLIVFVLVGICLLIWLSSKKRIVMCVVVLYRLSLGYLVEKELSLRFAQLYFECIRMGIPTKTALEMLQECKNDPLTVFLAWHIDQVLLNGGNLEQAMKIQYLEPSLGKIMKTAILSGEPIELLSGYLKVSIYRKEKRMQKLAKGIQVAAYGFVAMMILLIYQVLFLPLSMLERM